MDEKVQSRITLQRAYLLLYTVQNFFIILARCFKQVTIVVFHSKNCNLCSYAEEKKNPIENDNLMTSYHPLMSPNVRP